MTTPIVATAAGKVRGAEVADGVFGWRGIPYAAAPVGPLRLRPPRPPEPWSGVRDTTAYGPPALQPPPEVSVFGTAIELPPPSEDCLRLNVTAPAGASASPVLLWVHGGGYQSGSGTDMAGDGAEFARDHGLVVVTFNYRLGALGHLAVAGEEHSGAHGLHDQIAALAWVRENIAGFGGDPDRITLYGMSAGAKAVANLLASPLTMGMIHRAASSSGGADHVATPAQAAGVARRFLRELGTTPDRVRAVPAADLLAAQTAIGSGLRTTWVWRPAIDGLALTTHPLRAIAAGAAAGVPLLAQSCAHEAALYQLAVPDAADQTDRVLTEHFGPDGREQILAAYGGDRLAVMSDERYGIPTTRLADAQSAHAPVWRSRYDGPFTGLTPGFAFLADHLHAAHASDATAIWHGGDGLAAQLHEAFGTFATGHPPTAVGLPRWPRYTTDTRTTMLLTPTTPHPAADPTHRQREAWTGRHWPSGTWWHFDGMD